MEERVSIVLFRENFLLISWRAIERREIRGESTAAEVKQDWP
jgi:hypothetical protein